MITVENVTKSYSTEVVALRDASFDIANPELLPWFDRPDALEHLGGHRRIEQRAEPVDSGGHGTQVASVAVAPTIGVAPDARFIAARVIQPGGYNSLADQGRAGWGELPGTQFLVGEDHGFTADTVNLAGFTLGNLFTVGAEPALVFLHEGLGSIALWREFPARLAEVEARRAELAGLLQERLSAYNDLHLTLKHVHWNVVGPHFIAVHEMIDPQVDAVRLMVDAIAERIATLGVAPQGTPGALVAAREWDDYSIGRAGAIEHLGALDVVRRGLGGGGVLVGHRRRPLVAVAVRSLASCPGTKKPLGHEG